MLQSRVRSQWVGKGESPPGPGARVTLAEPLPRGGQQEGTDGLSLALWVVVLPIPPQEPDSRSPGRARGAPDFPLLLSNDPRALKSREGLEGEPHSRPLRLQGPVCEHPLTPESHTLPGERVWAAPGWRLGRTVSHSAPGVHAHPCRPVRVLLPGQQWSRAWPGPAGPAKRTVVSEAQRLGLCAGALEGPYAGPSGTCWHLLSADQGKYALGAGGEEVESQRAASAEAWSSLPRVTSCACRGRSPRACSREIWSPVVSAARDVSRSSWFYRP